MRVGVVGLGRMAAAIAGCLAADSGVTVTGFDLDAAKGGVASLSEVAAPQPLLAALSRDAVILDTSTLSPIAARRFAEEAASSSIAYLDAPVSGGPAGAAAGTLTVMVGRGAEALERARPVLDRIAARVVHVGPSGAGQVAKLVNNLLVATQLVVAGEALRIGEKARVSAEALLNVVNAASGRSAATEVNLPRWVLPGAFVSGFTAGLMRKDVRLAMELARDIVAEAPACARAATAWNAGIVGRWRGL
jgi:3-hydroxyisobutyrate dehydrogenase